MIPITLTCADYARGYSQDGRTLFPLPSLISVDGGKVAGKNVAIDGFVSNYTGPGTYGRDHLAGSGSDGGILVDYRPYSVISETTSQVTVEASGNGRWTFTRLAFDDGTGNPSPGINGTVTWTCRD